MRINLFCLLLFVSFFTKTNANSPFTDTHVAITSYDPCNLPPPTTFSVVEIGSTWVTLTWTAVSGTNYSHRIRTYEANTNILVSNDVVSGTQSSLTVTGLQQGKSYYSLINAICEDGSDSPLFLSSGVYTVIILDLIVTGYTPIQNYYFPCVINDQLKYSYCQFSSTGTTNFLIQSVNSGGPSRQFSLSRNANTGHVQLHMSSNGNTGETFALLCDYNNPEYFGGRNYQIVTSSGIPVVTLEITDATAGFMMIKRVGAINNQYRLAKLAPIEAKAPPQDEQHDGVESRTLSNGFSAKIAPNPFTDRLLVSLEPTDDMAPVTCSLYNTQGALVLTQNFPAGSSSCPLDTEKLPAGMYFLQIVSGDARQTIRVIRE